MATVCELVGLAAVAVACALVAIPLGVAVGGAGLVIVGLALERR